MIAASRSGIHAGAARVFFNLQRRGEQFVDLLARQDERQFLLELRQLQFAHRIDPQFFSRDQEAIESAKRGKLQANVGPRLFRFISSKR